MTENNFKEQDGKAAAAPIENESVKNEVSNTKSKKTVAKDTQVIREFLQSIGQYEADVLRICVAIADGKSTIESMAADERLALNRYLNNGVNKEHGTAVQIQEHRMMRAFKLMERAAGFCDKAQVLTVNQSLVSLAVSAKDIDDVVRYLNKLPEAGKPNAFGPNAGK